ncbi:hypothetical protein BTIS_0858 [Bifidobacterium tissieri]|uniref:Uncharacterized protein n=1 Tax=Bifidobacterium tissieri TaxID=1630162 RepID=A0A261FH72_9BIFI|nr:hypothetical protein [Bifidobacterium tissieri]OZG58489.1 hypothetical protein BTIS_0858 [Bifidobacterium tissieri]
MNRLFMKYHWVNQREWCLYGLAIVIISFAYVMSGWRYLSGGFARWSFLVTVSREGMLFGILILGMIGGYLGIAHSGRNVVVGRMAYQGYSRVFLPRMMVLVFVAVSGFIIGLLPLTIHVANRASWGSVDVLSLSSSCLVLCCVAVCSISLGALLSTRWAVVLVPTIMGFIVLLPVLVNQTVLVNTGLSSLQAAPVWMDDFPTLGWAVTAQTNLMRIALYLLLSCAVVRLSWRNLNGERILTDATAWLCAILSLAIVVGSLVNPAPLVRRDAARLVCKAVTQNAELCMHPADAIMEDMLSQAMKRTLTVVPESVRLQVVEGDSGSRIDGSDSRSDIRATYIMFTGEENVDESQNVIISSLAYRLSGQEECPVNEQSSDEDMARDEIVMALESSIAFRSGGSRIPVGVGEESGKPVYSEFQGRFDRLSDAEFVQWYADKSTMINTCTLSEKDLP